MSKENEESGERDFFDELGDLTELIEKCWFAAGCEAEFTKLMDSLTRRVQKFAGRHLLPED